MVSLRIGILGLGKMGQNHARVLSSLDDVELVGFFDPGQANFVDNVTNFKAAEDLVENSDAVIISSPTSVHLESVEKVARFAKPVLIEKPLASSKSEALEIISLMSGSEAEAAVGMVERFNPAAIVAKDLIRSGELGSINQISANREGPFSGRINDVGVGLDLAVHDLDLITWLSQSKVTVFEKITKALVQEGQEDYVYAIGALESEVIFNISANWRNPRKSRGIRVYGSRGVLDVDLLEMSVRLDRPGKIEVLWDQQLRLSGTSVGDSLIFGVQKQEPLRAELMQFINLATESERGDLASLEEAIYLVELLEKHK